MSSLKMFSRSTAPMQLSDFMNIPQTLSYENAELYWYEVQQNDTEGIELIPKNSGERFALLKQALLEIRGREPEGGKWGSYLELGFSSGRTLNFIAAIANNTYVYGFDSGNGVGNAENVQDRPFAYTKTIETKLEGSFRDEYGDNLEKTRKEGLVKLSLKPRTSFSEPPFIPFTPLCNVLLYLGKIEQTLPSYIKEEILTLRRTDHVSFVFIDTNDSAVTDSIIKNLAGYVKSGKTIIITDHQLDNNIVYRPVLLPNDAKRIVPLTQDTVDLKLHDFTQGPYATAAKASDKVPVDNTYPGRNVLHFKSTDRKRKFDDNKTMEKLRKHFANTQAKALMSDSEILQFGVDAARRNFALDTEKTKYYIEFGFCTGRSLNFIASLLNDDEKLYGFDSGLGLPENWRFRFPKGMFRYTKSIEKDAATGAITLSRIKFTNKEKSTLDDNVFIPFIPHERVNLVMGLIEEVLQPFVDKQLKPLGDAACIAFIYVDTDLKSAAAAILKTLKKYIQLNKTVIVFDEAFNFDGSVAEGAHVSLNEWEKHEFAALNEFRGDTGWRPIAYNQNGQQLAVVFQD